MYKEVENFLSEDNIKVSRRSISRFIQNHLSFLSYSGPPHRQP